MGVPTVMSTVTLILGKSGSGKSASLRNLSPEETGLIQVISKPLPFKSKGWKIYTSDNWQSIINACKKSKAKIIVIDDYQYVMANEFMRRAQEKNYDKFTEIGQHTWFLLNELSSLPSDVRVYILSHTEEVEDGQVKMKTIGKLLDDKITLEGMVTIVLRTIVNDGQHFFSTKNNGLDTTKSPMGMFDNDLIDNDLALVDKAICDYYDIKPTNLEVVQNG